jgi:YegS/Rv2252/BmrU family lipid kinase
MLSVIINPIAGGVSSRRAEERASLASALVERSGEAGEVFLTERRGHAGEIAAAARARGDRLVVAWGGDGTVNEVASALAFGPTALGIVPAGSGNGLAHALGLKRDPAAALRDALSAPRSRVRAIDAGEVDGRLFFNVSGFGFDAHVAACFDRDLGGRRGLTGYVRVTLRELARYRSATYRIGGVPSPYNGPALLVTLANSPEFGNGARIAPAALVDDGWLDLVVYVESSRWETLCAMPRLFTGHVGRIAGLSVQRVVEATVESDRPLTFHVDGEPVEGGRQIHVRVRPKAVLVVA